MPEQDLDVFTEEKDVAERTEHSWPRVLLALVGAGILAAVVVVIVSALLTADQQTATYTPNNNDGVVCGGEMSCTDLSVEQVEQLVALELPEDTEIITSSYEETDELIVVEARVALPAGAENPFEDSPYFDVESVDTVFPAGIVPVAFYAATGEMGALNADGLYGTGNDGRSIVAVVLRREL